MGHSVTTRDPRPSSGRFGRGVLAALVVIAVGTGWFHLAQRLLWSYVNRCGESVDAGDRFALSLAFLFGRGTFLALAAILLWSLARAVARHPRRFLTAIAAVLVVAVLITWLYMSVMVRVIDPAVLAELQARCLAATAGRP